MSNIRTAIESTVPAGYRIDYSGIIEDVIRAVEYDALGDPHEAITEVLDRRGAPSEAYRYVGQVLAAMAEPTPVTAQSGEVEGFDREHAAEVIRRHARQFGVQESAVEEVLVEAGLVDPEPEPEPEPESDDSVSDIARRIEQTVNGLARQVASLTEFARSNGYRG